MSNSNTIEDKKTVTSNIAIALSDSKSRRNLIETRLAALVKGDSFDSAEIPIDNNLTELGGCESFMFISSNDPIDIHITRGADTAKISCDSMYMLYGNADNIHIQTQEQQGYTRIIYYKDKKTIGTKPPVVFAKLGVEVLQRSGVGVQVPITIF